MQTGSILLVSSDTTQARIIQAFQSLSDKESSRWNHSGIILQTNYDNYVVEETPIEGRKFKAAARIRPLSAYFESPDQHHELMLLDPIHPVDPAVMERLLFQYVGIPYDYKNLLIDQVKRTITGKYSGRIKDAWHQMICQEFTQFIWHEYSKIYFDVFGILFPEFYQADVVKIYYDKHFIHSMMTIKF